MARNLRQQEILQMIQREGYAAIEALAERFQVTPQTVRRDINALCDEGLLIRYHGGAGLPPSSVENIAYPARQVMNHEAKRKIGELTARYIPDHASLFINIGTTTEEVAKALRHHKGLRVITNNLHVATILCANPDIEVIIAGGVVRHRDHGVVGEATLDFIRQFKVDYGVIGISGIDSDGTLLDFDYREVRVSEAIMANSRKVLLVADHSKFNRNALVRLANISQIHGLFTDRSLVQDLQDVMAAYGTEVYVANDDGENKSTKMFTIEHF